MEEDIVKTLSLLFSTNKEHATSQIIPNTFIVVKVCFKYHMLVAISQL